jgi:hypothetical protein
MGNIIVYRVEATDQAGNRHFEPEKWESDREYIDGYGEAAASARAARLKVTKPGSTF